MLVSCRRVGQRAIWRGIRAESTSPAADTSPAQGASPTQGTSNLDLIAALPGARPTQPGKHPLISQALGYRAIVLRTVQSIESPVDAFAIIRALERRFGRVAEYRFHRVCLRLAIQAPRCNNFLLRTASPPPATSTLRMSPSGTRSRIPAYPSPKPICSVSPYLPRTQTCSLAA
jgi:hypothetical protein